MKITTQGKITYYYKYRQYAATSNRQWWPVVKLVIDDTAGTSYPFLLSGKAATLAQGYEAG